MATSTPPSRFQSFVATDWIEGEIRHRRKLYKKLFFIDVLLTNNDKVQVLFRCDDGSMDSVVHQDCLRLARPGHRVQLHVGRPTDPTEGQDRTFPVYQCTTLPDITCAYNDPKPFIADPPLVNKTRETIKQWNGQEKAKKEMTCKYWLNQRQCHRLETCPFQHPTGPEFEIAREAWVQERLEIRKIITMDPKDPHTDKKPHALRALIFAQWIHSFLMPRIQHSGGVLDVAGGKGDVSMFLCHAFGISSTVVEPHPRKQPNYWLTRLRRLMEKHIYGNDNDDERRTQPWPFPDLHPTFMPTLLDDAFVQQYHDTLLPGIHLMIGLHADQATEPIVDTALRLGKPFAVVPCCVFGRENLHRRLATTGGPVETTQDLIQYLCEKDTGGYGGKINTAYLDFEGKNQVVYWIPPNQ
ncbi:hypothetical protein BC941DRAFT_381974 [Chlamydoabsidia padenii]|nr:hypothetical protein BC941DRAFT_381974 [Chlamydoabsidia padenii]